MTRLLIYFFALMLWSGITAASSTPIKAEQLDLTQYQGKLVYLDFWASWCGPCRQSFPWMAEMQEKYGQQGLSVIAVNVDEDSALAHQFLDQLEHNFQIVLDPQGEIAQRYELMGMPSSFLLNAQGQVLDSHTGFRVSEKAELQEKIERGLNALAKRSQGVSE